MPCLTCTSVIPIGHFRNVRGLGKSMVVFHLFEKLRYSNERSTEFESLYHQQKRFKEENGKMVALQISPKIGQTGHKIIRICMEICSFSGLEKYLNSILPIGQVTLKFCLPGALPHLPDFSNSLIIHEPKMEVKLQACCNVINPSCLQSSQY